MSKDGGDSLVAAMYAYAVALIFALMLTIFVKIGKNSVEWQPNGRMERFLQKGCAFLSCVVQSEAIYNDDRIISWLFICTCSTFFPSMVLTMIESVSGLTRARPTNMLTAGRAVPIMLFGIRYGLVANLTGVPGCLDAVLFQSVLRNFKSERMAPLFITEDCFFTDIPRSVRIGYVSLRVVVLSAFWNAGVPTYHPLDSLSACLLLLVVNYLVNHLIVLGNVIASYVYEQAQVNVLPNQAGVRKVCNLAGSLSFATWLLLLGGIILSY